MVIFRFHVHVVHRQTTDSFAYRASIIFFFTVGLYASYITIQDWVINFVTPHNTLRAYVDVTDENLLK